MPFQRVTDLDNPVPTVLADVDFSCGAMTSLLNHCLGEKRCMNINVFVKPDDQSQTCLSFGMARKGA